MSLSFDDSHAGLVPVMAVAKHARLAELAAEHVRPGDGEDGQVGVHEGPARKSAGETAGQISWFYTAGRPYAMPKFPARQKEEFQVRRAILAGAIFVSAIGVALGTGVTPASAQGSFPDNVCIPQGSSPTQCINDWDGNLDYGAAAARFYHYGNSGGYNAIDVLALQPINQTNGGFQPFTDGSGLNARYNGRPVYEFEWWRNGKDTGVCIAGTSYNADAYNEQCNDGGYSVLFVYSSSSGLISVNASNALYANTKTANQPVWLGSNGKGNIGTGDNVYLTTTQSNNLPWGFFTDGG
jgi:hypothetical protein